jgi:hypothetical protein
VDELVGLAHRRAGKILGPRQVKKSGLAAAVVIEARLILGFDRLFEFAPVSAILVAHGCEAASTPFVRRLYLDDQLASCRKRGDW